MTATLLFIGITLPLVIEGWLIVRLILRSSAALALALSLPVAALINVLIIYDCTVLSIPLMAATIVPAHLIVIGIAGWMMRIRTGHEYHGHDRGPEGPLWGVKNPLRFVMAIVSGCILSAAIIYSFSHAVLLPTFQYDSATNWTMRSEISWYDRAIAFDTNEDRGMAKPQYPVLFHMLQLTANAGQTEWNDTAANAILWLLSLGSFSAIYLILRRRKTRLQSLVTVTLAAACIPLVAIHLAQGYGDLNLLQYLLLSLVCLAEYMDLPTTDKRHSMRWLAMSAILITAGVWTKSEGWLFGLLPWLVLLGLHAWKHPALRKPSAITAGICILMTLPWYILLWIKGLNLTPHSTDTAFTFHAEAVSEALAGLFSRGSFGPLWYVMPAAIGLILFLAYKKHPLVERRHVPLLAWGGILFLEVLFIYLCTPNVVFLMNAQSFYRQMMIPGVMLILGCSLCIDWKTKSVSPKV